jgi:hypothetical protein
LSVERPSISVRPADGTECLPDVEPLRMHATPATVEHLAIALTARLEQHRIALLGTLVTVGVSLSALIAYRKPFWHDEIFTILISGLPSTRSIWRAELDGVEFFPPLNAFVTHVLHRTLGVGPVVTRLPAIVGFWAASLVVFEMVRRRSNIAVGLTAFMLPFLTPAFRYSYEARGYGLMLFLFAASLFAWSEAARGNRRHLYLPLLALALAASVWNHYFAVLTFAPLAVGEVMRLWEVRRPDWPMYGAFVVAGLMVLPLVPLIGAAARAAPPHWRSHGLAGQLRGAYLFLIGSLLARRFLAVAAVGIAWTLIRRFRGARLQQTSRALPLHEIAAGLTCLCLPAGAIFLGLATGAFYFRYALPFIVGLACVIPLAAWRLSAAVTVDLFVCFVSATVFAQLARQAVSAASLAAPDPFKSRPALTSQFQRGKLIVLSDVDYLQMWYYAPAEWRARVWYLADPGAALAMFGTSTMDSNLLALRKYSPVTVSDYQSFVATQPTFVVVARREGHWLLSRLEHDGARLLEIGQEMGVEMYDVSFPGRATPALTNSALPPPTLDR